MGEPTIIGGTLCPHCGRDNFLDAKFCDNCRTPLAEYRQLQMEISARDETINRLQSVVDQLRREATNIDSQRHRTERDLRAVTSRLTELEQDIKRREEQIKVLTQSVSEANQTIEGSITDVKGFSAAMDRSRLETKELRQKAEAMAAEKKQIQDLLNETQSRLQAAEELCKKKEQELENLLKGEPSTSTPEAPPETPTETKKYCRNCGSLVSATSKFCRICGTPRTSG